MFLRVSLIFLNELINVYLYLFIIGYFYRFIAKIFNVLLNFFNWRAHMLLGGEGESVNPWGHFSPKGYAWIEILI